MGRPQKQTTRQENIDYFRTHFPQSRDQIEIIYTPKCVADAAKIILREMAEEDVKMSHRSYRLE